MVKQKKIHLLGVAIRIPKVQYHFKLNLNFHRNHKSKQMRSSNLYRLQLHLDGTIEGSKL